MIRSLLFLIFMAFGFPSHAAAERLLSLDLCTDWMLLRFASPDQVRAYSPFLYQYQNPMVTPGLPTHDGSLEQIISLDPAVIITGEFNAIQVRKRLGQLGHQVNVLANPQGLNDVDKYINNMMRILGLPEWEGKQIHSVADGTAEPNPNPSLLLLGANGIGTGQNTLEHEMLTAAGWSNYLRQAGYQSINLEALVNRPPDAVLVTGQSNPSLADRFSQHPAIKAVVKTERWKTHADWRWQCPGPWSFELIEQLAAWKKN